MIYYLGIDGGGSKTRCAVGDEVSQLAAADAGSSNITRVGESRARESLHYAVRAACAAARIDPRQIRRTCVGVAGGGREEVAGAVKKIIAELIPNEIEVVGDMTIALEAAFDVGPGVIVIAGTGSIAYGRNAKGQTARAGGWGYAISDEGSAHWIGRAVVSAVLRAMDEGASLDLNKDAQGVANALPLCRQLRAAWKLESLDQFVRTANSSPDFAGLFPTILAADGDPLVQRVLIQAGEELARIAGVVARRIFPEEDTKAVPLAIAGGVFCHSRQVREVFGKQVQQLDSRIAVNMQVIEPVVGALQMARRHA